ncbi:MAG: DNA gyrase subunit A, partial [Firmicutes bacterium]|nr:DNA gyrase subunit A [Bacillota bacterium]
LVRLAQDFSMRYTMVDGHGNFGSSDGDRAAAMRYTEARMAKIAMEMMSDLNKDTVDFVDNYDGEEKEPTVLPSRIPNLLVNGSSGIAVGMATNIPPHNLTEIIDGLIMLLDNPATDIDQIMEVVTGPDFPTGGLILGRQGITEAYKTGRGSIKLRARTVIEQMNNGKQRIVVSELPYQVTRSQLIQKIAELVQDKKIEGITDVRDESDKEGTRVVIEVKKDANASVILNQLFTHTQLQISFGVIMLALVGGVPKILSIKEMMEHYLHHQEEVIVRRSRFDLKRAQERAHIVEGLKIALDYIDEVIAVIRASHDDAKERLMERFNLSEEQAKAILDMQLRRLQGLEREKLDEEYRDLIKKIAYLTEVLNNEKMVQFIVKDELTQLRDKYGDDRRTVIVPDEGELTAEDLIAEEDMVITITNNGYIKRLSTDTYRQQRRGGRGVTAMATKDEDFVRQLFITTTHHYLVVFTNKGRAYRLKVHQIPEAGRHAKGTAIVNLLSLTGEDKITAVIPIREYVGDKYLLMATAKGIVKKSLLSEYDSSRKDGLIGIKLDEGDELIGVKLTDGDSEIILSTRNGSAIRFNESEIRPMGRATRGVRGISLNIGDSVASLDCLQDNGQLLLLSEKGYGKRTNMVDFRFTHRGGKGVSAIKCNDKTGHLIAIEVVCPGDEMMIVTKDGIIIRVPVDDISQQGRYAQGVRVIKLEEGDSVVDMAKVMTKEEEDISILRDKKDAQADDK